MRGVVVWLKRLDDRAFGQLVPPPPTVDASSTRAWLNYPWWLRPSAVLALIASVALLRLSIVAGLVVMFGNMLAFGVLTRRFDRARQNAWRLEWERLGQEPSGRVTPPAFARGNLPVWVFVVVVLATAAAVLVLLG